MKRALVVLLCCAAWVAPAWAMGLNVSGHVGPSQVDEAAVGLAADLDDTGWKALVGWKFIPVFAVEGGYVDFGDLGDDGSTIQQTEADLTAWIAQVRASLPLLPFFKIYALAGLADWDFEGQATIPGSPTTVTSLDDSGTDAIYGAGLAFHFTKLEIRIEAETFDLEPADGAWLATVGLQFEF